MGTVCECNWKINILFVCVCVSYGGILVCMFPVIPALMSQLRHTGWKVLMRNCHVYDLQESMFLDNARQFDFSVCYVRVKIYRVLSI